MSIKRITDLFHTSLPIVQAGMVWCSGWRLASAVSECGGLGLLGAGSMHPPVLREHIQKCRAATSKPFGVNIPLLYPDIDEIIKIVLDEQVPIIFTSAGSPKKWTPLLKQHHRTVVHVISNSEFAKKSEDAGVDAVVAEGFEAGGHNGREETTTFVLLPLIRKAVSLPILAAGGIASGEAMLAAEVLGAEGFQIGSLFATAEESSAHVHFKEKIIEAKEGDTQLMMKKLTPVRLLKNDFFARVKVAEEAGESAEQLAALLGKGRAKKGMFEGNLDEGELEIGQVAAQIKSVRSVRNIMDTLWREYQAARHQLHAE